MLEHPVAAEDRVPAGGAQGMHCPYAQPHANFMYNLLFCDDITLFMHGRADQDTGIWRPLLADATDQAVLRQIAEDEANDSRVRVLACNRLRLDGVALPVKQLLGVIVEVALDEGLDVLAAFSDGGVRYLNQSGKLAVFEGLDTPVAPLAHAMVAVSASVVDRIGPWEEARLPPPSHGRVRLSFLVSDGLYFGEGPFAGMQGDPMAGPILSAAARLLEKTVDTALATAG